MIPLTNFKELLGDAAEGLSDLAIEQTRDMEYQLADVFFEQWLRKLNESQPT